MTICSFGIGVFSFQNIRDNFTGEFNQAKLQKTSCKVLFIGNSLTYTNNLPFLVKEEAAFRGFAMEVKQVTLPNYGISDHLLDGEIQKLILSGNYDYVIIQQGPSSQPYGRETLINYGKVYKQLCDKGGAELVFFMVWPSRKYYHTFDGVIASYHEAAKVCGSMICPVGEVWKEHFDTTNDFSYYGPDGFHPSLKGSKVAANLIVDSLFKEK